MTRVTNVAGLRALLASADTSSIERALSDLIISSPERWMNPSQRYSDGRVRSKLARVHPLPAATARAFAPYAAASTFLHAADAWSFLGRALSCFATGDIPTAQHLLYYSELRSAQAILARHGIVLLDKNPFVYVGGGTASLKGVLENASTHMATWDVFSAWTMEYGADFLGRVIRVSARSAREWSDARPTPLSLDATASSLLLRWGLDLSNLKADRALRNVVSYEPSRLVTGEAEGPSPADVARAFREMWSLLEPDGAGGFEAFDLALLRHMMQAAHFASTGTSYLSSRRFHTDTKTTLDNLAIGPRGEALLSYLTGTHATDDLLKLARKKASVRPRSDTDELIAMRSRALILGRLAIGAAVDLASSTGIQRTDLRFWADDLLVSHGISTDDLEDYYDLWNEVEVALEDIEAMGDIDNPSLLFRCGEWSQPIRILSSLERVPAWAIS